MAHAGRVITKTALCEHVREHHFDTGTNVVEVRIQRLRPMLDAGRSPKLLTPLGARGM